MSIEYVNLLINDKEIKREMNKIQSKNRNIFKFSCKKIVEPLLMIYALDDRITSYAHSPRNITYYIVRNTL